MGLRLGPGAGVWGLGVWRSGLKLVLKLSWGMLLAGDLSFYSNKSGGAIQAAKLGRRGRMDGGEECEQVTSAT